MSTFVNTIPFRISQKRFWLGTLGLVGINVLAPIFLHSIPKGGQIFLPLFLGTLVAARLGGPALSLLVALVSPLLSYALTGMPVLAMLPVILAKSASLGLVAGLLSSSRKVSIQILLPFLAILAMITVGFLGERLMGLNLAVSFTNIVISWPGMLIMVLSSLALWIVQFPNGLARKTQ